MTYPDPPLSPNMPPPFSGGNVGDFWPQPPMNEEYPNSHSILENPPPFKKSRNSENNPPNFAPFPPTNPRMNPQNFPVNKGTTHIFYKTRMCAKYIEGNCRNGDNCTFAHGAEDLREPPPNWQELVRDRGAGNWNDDQRITHRMKICKKFYNGEECPYGEKCNFLHERSAKYKADLAIEMAMERTRESSVINIATMGSHIDHKTRFDQPKYCRHLSSSSDAIRVSVTADSDVSRVNVNANLDAFRATVKPSYWKTKICTKWEITGQCMFGDRCHFAHGHSELKAPGERVDAEAVMNTGPVAAKAVMNVPIVSNGPPTNTVVVAVPAKEGEARGFFAKWKGQGRISRVYADWIDDDDEEEQIPPPCLPSQVEN